MPLSQKSSVEDLMPTPPVHCKDSHWLKNASQLLIYHRLQQQQAKINKRWRVAAFEQAKEVARRAVEESKEMDRKLQEVADQIEAQGYTIVWETPKQGVFLPYIVNAEEGGIFTWSFNGNTPSNICLGLGADNATLH